MSKTDIFELFYQNSESLGGRRILLLLCVGLLIGAIIFVTYRITYQGVSYSTKFNVSNVVILLITIVIMIMISSNIVISLGMVGALSIVRFRTAIKDPRDTVFIFWSIVEGLSIGSQNLKLALISVLFIAILFICTSFYAKLGTKYLFIVKGESPLDPEQVQSILKKYGKHVRLRATNRSDISSESIFELLTVKQLNTLALQEIQSLDGVHSVNALLETGETVG